MEIEVKPVRRRSSWALRLAFRSIIMGVMGVVAASIVQSAALPRLQEESRDVERSAVKYLPPGLAQEVTAHRPVSIAGVQLTYLTLIPAAAALLGIAAIAFRPLRGVLAVVATLLAVGAFILIVTSLVTAMAPLYRLPA